MDRRQKLKTEEVKTYYTKVESLDLLSSLCYHFAIGHVC